MAPIKERLPKQNCGKAATPKRALEAVSFSRDCHYFAERGEHSYVDSEANVAITTGTVNSMKAEPSIAQAEALRRAEAALIARGGRWAHPSVWAPFVLVGGQ